MIAYAEPVAASNFSFLRGASPAQRLVMASLLLGHTGLGIADRNTVAGVVRAHAALKELRDGGVLPKIKLRDGSGPGEYRYEDAIENPDDPHIRAILQERAQSFRLLIGTRLVFADDTPDIVAYPKNRLGWGQLCRLLTTGNIKSKKGECHLTLADLQEQSENLCLIIMPPEKLEGLAKLCKSIRTQTKWLAAAMPRRGKDKRRLFELRRLAAESGLKLIATNDVLYAEAGQRDLQDILTCIREGVTIQKAGRRLESNAERHLKSPDEMARLFADAPEAITETQTLLSHITFTLDELRYEYPDEPIPQGYDAQAWLEELTRQKLPERYPEGVSVKVQNILSDELKLIAQLNYARYFLTVHDIVKFARSKGILCQGRGSAANSAVCYVLGITAVDPAAHDLLFARFISAERNEPPDIDVDFEHERREEVIQYIYQHYGRHRAGIAATVITYRPKSAIREAGKALGLSEDVTSALSTTQWGSYGSDITANQIRQAGLDPDNPEIARLIYFARRLLGFPRHLSQHVGGFILTRGRLDELVPIGNAAMEDRTFIEWDKDDIDTLGLMKIDVLALGMLTCIRKAFDELSLHEGLDLDLADVKEGDTETYDMLCKGDSIGVFQVESRAQINMLPRMKPRVFYDLVIQVAIVRPGPIQGNMVHPYLRRRSGLEDVTYPSPAPEHGPADELYQVLNKTKGVPLFQEQAMKLAMVAAKFTDIEANQLRRAMATFRHNGTIHMFESLMIERMVARGYDLDFASNCYEQIKGFGSYGFPESHAASFAKLVYVSSWIKCHHPAVFACALLNSQPMGFYAPAQIVRDAREHGVTVLPVDVNYSRWDNHLTRDDKGLLCLRLGFRQVDGVHEEDIKKLCTYREERELTSIEDFAITAGVPLRSLRKLADADCFRSLGLDRRQALWDIRRIPDNEALPLFAAANARELNQEPDPHLPEMPLSEHVATDYQTLRLSLKAHPMEVLRPILTRENILSCKAASERRNGAWVRTAGVVLVRQRPGKGNAIFITLEDETGVTNVVLWASKFEEYRRTVMAARLMLVEGRLQRSDEGVIHLMAERLHDRSPLLLQLFDEEQLGLASPVIPPAHHDHPRDVRVLPKLSIREFC
jgi:error-prone DNA polymerase